VYQSDRFEEVLKSVHIPIALLGLVDQQIGIELMITSDTSSLLQIMSPTSVPNRPGYVFFKPLSAT
jgi:hypothetical protein